MNIPEAKSPRRDANQALAKKVKTEPPSASVTDSAIRRTSMACTPEERQTMISEAAYFIAKHRNFARGHELEDWLCGERQIDAAIARGELLRVYPT
jgi:hypothetical protein